MNKAYKSESNMEVLLPPAYSAEYQPEQIGTFFKIMEYMFPKHLESIMPILSRFTDKKQKLSLLIARGNCCNVINYNLEDLGIETYKILYGGKLLEPINFEDEYDRKYTVTKTTDYWIFLGHSSNLNNIVRPCFKIAHKLKKISFMSLVTTHANPDSTPEFIIRNFIRGTCYCILDFHEVPMDYEIFIHAILNSPMLLKIKTIILGPTYMKKMEILHKAQDDADSIIAKAEFQAQKIYEASIAELEKKKKELETEIVDLQRTRMTLKLDVAVGQQIIKSTIEQHSGFQLKPEQSVQSVQSIEIIPTLPHQPAICSRGSRILPIINVERMKQTAALLPPEDQEKYKSSVGLNINAAQFTIGKFA